MPHITKHSQQVDLASRRGDGALTLFMAFLPLAVLLLTLALNGMALAYGYKQAHSLARLAALAGAGAVLFGGDSPEVDTASACLRARALLEANGAYTLHGFAVTCRATGQRVSVRIVTGPGLVIRDTLGIFPKQIAVEAHSAPVYGINEAEVK